MDTSSGTTETKYPSNGATREYLLDLMERLAVDFADDNAELRESSNRVRVALARAHDAHAVLGREIERWQESLRHNSRHVQHAAMIGPIWQMITSDNSHCAESCEVCGNGDCPAWLFEHEGETAE